jgi:hypothetical protein
MRALAPCVAAASPAASSSLMRRWRAHHGRGGLDISVSLKIAIPLCVHGWCIHGRLTVHVLKCASGCRRRGRSSQLWRAAPGPREDLAAVKRGGAWRRDGRPPSLYSSAGGRQPIPSSPCSGPPPNSRRQSGGTAVAVSSVGAEYGPDSNQ